MSDKGRCSGLGPKPDQANHCAQGVDLKNAVDVHILIPRLSLLFLAFIAAPVQAQTLMVWGDDASSQISGALDGKFKAIAGGGSINGLVLRKDWTPILLGDRPNRTSSEDFL